jgi:hypothetical protein
VQDFEQALAALRVDPTRPVRVRVGDLTVELRIMAEPPAGARSVLGLFGNEPELIDEVCEEAMQARERDPLRRTDA